MKTTKIIRLILYFPALILGLTSCNSDDTEIGTPQGSTPVITIEDNEYELRESSDSLVLRLMISPKPIAEGSIQLKLSGNAEYNLDYTTNPPFSGNNITLPFSQSQEYISLVLYRKISELQEEKELQIQLTKVPEGYKMGEHTTANVTIVPRQTEINSVNFEYSSLKIREDHWEGMTIFLKLTQATKKSEQITLKMVTTDRMEYGTRFNTTPEPALDELILNVLPGATTASLNFKPINDHFLNGSSIVIYQLNALTSGLKAGENNSLEVTLEDDDEPIGTLHKISEVRELFQGSSGDWYFPEDFFIEGVITSDLNVLDGRTIYLQDETAGILLRFFQTNIFKIGDKIRLNLKSASGININGQKGIDQVNPEGYVIVAKNMMVQAEEITLDQLLGGSYEGKRVVVRNVAFVNADGSRNFLGNQTISDDNREAVVTTYESALFSSTILPSGLVSISGIVGDWGRIMPQQYSEDIKKN
ncbi:DUF5689 domain-containing protein [Flavobacteriaceae bacterium KMM 6897]|nr:DUF5689 domain-containing protein [Flavobacteriaceae bacterium KMM 6897]